MLDQNIRNEALIYIEPHESRGKNTLYDLSKCQNPLLVNRTSFAPAPNGRTIINFDGVADIIRIADISKITITAESDFTMMVWVKSYQYISSNGFPIFELKSNTSYYGAGIFLSNGLRFRVRSQEGIVDIVNSDIPLNKWACVQVIYDGTSKRLSGLYNLNPFSTNNMTNRYDIKYDYVLIGGCASLGGTNTCLYGRIGHTILIPRKLSDVELSNFSNQTRHQYGV